MINQQFVKGTINDNFNRAKAKKCYYLNEVHKHNLQKILAGTQYKQQIPEKRRKVLYLESKITGCLSASAELTTNWVCMALGT